MVDCRKFQGIVVGKVKVMEHLNLPNIGCMTPYTVLFLPKSDDILRLLGADKACKSIMPSQEDGRLTSAQIGSSWEIASL